LKELVNVEDIEKRAKEEGKPELEKGDLFAITIAAIRVFLPVLLGFIGVVYLLAWIYTRGF
jgi:hypothetical protein